MSEINSHTQAIARRLRERSELMHVGALLHLEASRRLLEQGLRDSCHAGISLAMSRESMRLDTQLLKIIRQHPDIEISTSNDYQQIRSIGITDNTSQLTQSDAELVDALKAVEFALY